MLKTDETPGRYTTGAAALFALTARGESLTELKLRQRRAEILEAFLAGSALPTPELLKELAELNLALGEAG